MLGHLAPEERGTHLPAPVGHPGHQLGHLARVNRSGRDVVEQEQRFRTVAHQVVHAHGHQVDAQAFDPAHRLGHQRLGAHPVGTGHQHRLPVPGGVQREQSTETAEAAEHFGPVGGGHQRFDQFDRPVPGGDIHPGRRVGGRDAAGRMAGVGGNGVGYRTVSGHAWVPLATPLSAVGTEKATGTFTG